MKKHEFPGFLFHRIGKEQIETSYEVNIVDKVRCRVAICPIIDPSREEGELGWLRLAEPAEGGGPEQPVFLEFYETRKKALDGDSREVKYAIWHQPTRFGGTIMSTGNPIGRGLSENCQWGIGLLTHAESTLSILVDAL